MAKAKEKVNKSQLIRDTLKAHRGKSPAEIAAMVNEQHQLGISAQYVSTVKSNMKNKKRARKLSKTASAPSSERGALFAAATLLMKAGGVAEARAALDAIAKVASLIK